MRARRSTPPAHTRTRALAALLLTTALTLTACSGAGSGSSDADGGNAKAAAPRQNDSQADAEPGAAGEAAPGAAPAAPPELAPTHIIRTADLTVQVKDTAKALNAARTATENAGGYVGDENTTRDADGHESTEVVLRVPVDRYDDVMKDLEGAGKLMRRDAKAEDVTDQVVDVDSRVKSQRASVARVRELMDRADRLSDVVTLEGELSTRQAQLESLLAQQSALRDRTSLATITLSLSETPVKRPEPKKEEDPGFTDALAGGWDAFVTMLRWLAVILGALLPFAVVAALLAFLWLRVVRPLLSRRPTPAPAPAPAPTTPPAAASVPLPSARPAAPDAARDEELGGKD